MHQRSFKDMPAFDCPAAGAGRRCVGCPATRVRVACDVLVVGAGVAGVAAAVAAARAGCTTLLLEKMPFLGGTATAGLHRFICGLYLTDTREAGEPLNGGISREFCRRLGTTAAAAAPVRFGRTFVLPCATQPLMDVLGALLSAESGLRVRRDTEVVAVERDGNRIAAVTACGPRSLLEVTPRTVVDCSGDVVVLRLAGGPFGLAAAARRQLAGFSVFIKGLADVDQTLCLKVPYCLSRGADEKSLPDCLRFSTFLAGDRPDEGYLKLGLSPARDPDRSRRALAAAEQAHRYLRRVLPAFRESYVAGTSPYVLEREGARLRGDCTLSEADVLAGRKFPDAIARAAWPIEFWDQQRGPRYRYLPPGEYYEVPRRCLRTRKIANLWCAGRCISATPRALASARAAGTCLALGEAAGHEAALQAREAQSANGGA